MRWFLTGGTGQLGSALLRLLLTTRPDDDIIAPTRDEVDLSSSESLAMALRDARPDVVLNCAAWTDVDAAEVCPKAAWRLNAEAPQTIARTIQQMGHGLLIQVSTDYVFDGESSIPYGEDEPAHPLSEYGRSKESGEHVLTILPDRSLVVRTAWLYGSGHGDFVSKVRRTLDEPQDVKVVDDQYGHPTWARDVAGRLMAISLGAVTQSIPLGVTYHAVNEGVASRFELAQEIARLFGRDPEIILPVSTHTLVQAARRPVRVELSDQRAIRLGVPPMRPWREALRAYITTL